MQKIASDSVPGSGRERKMSVSNAERKSEMGQMTITAYTDENFSSEYKSALELPINPDKVKFTKGIQYAEDKQLGSLNGSNVYARYRPETLYFECLLDMTNALDDDREKKPVHDVVNDLEQRLYCYNSEGHRP